MKNFQNHALILVTTTVAEPDKNSQIYSGKQFQMSNTNHFPDSDSQQGVCPLPTVDI